jgi:hypothetical protein
MSIKLVVNNEMSIKRFKDIFKGLERAHGCTKINAPTENGVKVKGQSFVVRQPVTDDLWRMHLQGTQSLGIIPINEDDECIWGCVDIDSYAGFDHKKLINKIKEAKLPLVVCRSKSGGAHVFLFATKAISAEVMRDKLTEIKTILGYGGSEVFPKQIKLKSQDDTGNFLNLPYFNGDDTTRYAFTEAGGADTLVGFFDSCERNKQTPQQLQQLKITRPVSEYSDGPPCIELMAINKIPEGGRNNAMFHYGVYAKKKWPAEWKSRITMFNIAASTTPLSESEVDIIKRQHDKKDWGYKCNDVPMCNLCDKKLCKTRKYGIGDDLVFPLLADLQKVKLEKPYYYLNVDGQRLHLENVKFLKQQSLFQEACMEQLDFKPPTVKPKDWDMIINPLMKNHEPVEPPEGVTTADQLRNHLEEFCLNRHIGTAITDLKNGGVWNHEGYHHFIFNKFYTHFLIRQRWDINYQRTAQMLKETCNCEDKRIGKERISVFAVKQFDKRKDDYVQKELKPKDVF